MSGFQDVRDVMELSGPTDAMARIPAAKKQKTVERRPGMHSHALRFERYS